MNQIVLAWSHECEQELLAMGFKKKTVYIKHAPGATDAEAKRLGEREIFNMEFKPYQFCVTANAGRNTMSQPLVKYFVWPRELTRETDLHPGHDDYIPVYKAADVDPLLASLAALEETTQACQTLLRESMAVANDHHWPRYARLDEAIAQAQQALTSPAAQGGTDGVETSDMVPSSASAHTPHPGAVAAPADTPDPPQSA